MRRSSDPSKRGNEAIALERLAGRVEVLSERVDTLAQTVATTSSASARKDGAIALLRRELESGLARVDALAAEGRSGANAEDVRQLRAQLAALAADRAKTADTKRVEDLTGKVAVLAQRVNTLGSTVATAAASVAGRDGEVAALRRLLDQRDPGPTLDAALLRRVEDAAAASASVTMRIESQREQLAELTERLEGRDDEVSSTIAELGSALGALASRVGAIETGDEDVTRTLRELAGRLEALEERERAAAPELMRATTLLPTALRALEGRVEQLAQGNPPERTALDSAGSLEPEPAAADVLAAVRALEQRLTSADAAAREGREAVLERLERLMGNLERSDEVFPVGAEVLRFRGTDS